MAISPLLLKAIKKFNSILILILGFIIYIFAFYVRFYTPGHGWILEKFGTLGMTLFEYLIGAIFCKTRLLTKTYHYISKVLKNKFVIGVLAVILFLTIVVIRTLVVPNIFVAPATGIIIIALFHYWRKPKFVKNLFAFMGKHSTVIWLTHMFFYTPYLFDGLVFKVKYPVLIFLFILTLCIASSYVVSTIYKLCEYLWRKLSKSIKKV